MGGNWKKPLAIVAGVMAAVGVASADKAEDTIRYRQGMLMGMGWNVGAMGAMVKGDIPFDAAKFAFLAGRTAQLAPMVLEGFTPDTKGAESNAKPALWENFPDFEKRMKENVTSTAKLAEVAQAGDVGAMKAQFGEAVEVCKGCHDKYREKD